jgi:hypothetical protein
MPIKKIAVEIVEILGWLGPRVGFVLVLAAVGYAMAGGTGQKVAVFAAYGLISFSVGYLVSMFINIE